MAVSPWAKLIGVVVLCLPMLAWAQRGREYRNDLWPAVIPVYVCQQVANDAVIVDGVLNESCWTAATRVDFVDLIDGSTPTDTGYAALCWDDQYLYVAYHLEAPQVWATIDSTAAGANDESCMMFADPFIAFYLDPDGDGRRYMEWHVNAAGAQADLLLKRSPSYTGRVEQGLPIYPYPEEGNWAWSLPGMRAAVQVQGTLNQDDDSDTGWSVELALPWDELSSLTEGHCPPVTTKSWRMLVSRVERTTPESDARYWTWPMMGVKQCHLPARWAVLSFVPIDAHPAPR